jgi:hypothetical protein
MLERVFYREKGQGRITLDNFEFLFWSVKLLVKTHDDWDSQGRTAVQHGFDRREVIILGN